MVNSVGRAKTVRFSLNFHEEMIGSLRNKLLNNISLFMLIVLGGTKTLCKRVYDLCTFSKQMHNNLICTDQIQLLFCLLSYHLIFIISDCAKYVHY